jgi:hypothetical protein
MSYEEMQVLTDDLMERHAKYLKPGRKTKEEKEQLVTKKKTIPLTV